MTDALIEHLASMDIHRLSSEELALELDFANRERALSGNKEYCEYQTKRIAALDREQTRRKALKERPKTSAMTTDFIQALKQRVDIRDVFNDLLGILVRPSGPHRGCYPCPAHTDRHPSGVIYVDDQQYHCFSCMAHGDVFDCLMAFKGLTFLQAVDAVAGYLGVEMPKAKTPGKGCVAI
jgi:hypothetical protein